MITISLSTRKNAFKYKELGKWKTDIKELFYQDRLLLKYLDQKSYKGVHGKGGSGWLCSVRS